MSWGRGATPPPPRMHPWAPCSTAADTVDPRYVVVFEPRCLEHSGGVRYGDSVSGGRRWLLAYWWTWPEVARCDGEDDQVGQGYAMRRRCIYRGRRRQARKFHLHGNACLAAYAVVSLPGLFLGAEQTTWTSIAGVPWNERERGWKKDVLLCLLQQLTRKKIESFPTHDVGVGAAGRRRAGSCWRRGSSQESKDVAHAPLTVVVPEDAGEGAPGVQGFQARRRVRER